MRSSIFILLILGATYAAADSAKISNPPLYSVEVVSLNQANVFDASGLLIATLDCRAFLESKDRYRVDCPRSVNHTAEFTTLLNYDSSEDGWGSYSNVSPLIIDGRPTADVPCSADGTFVPTSPKFPISCHSY